MKTKILFMLLLLLAIKVNSQQLDKIDTCTFFTGVPSVVNDSTRVFTLNGLYAYVYVIIQDTGSTYTDSVRCFSITNRRSSTDSVVTPINMRNVTTYLDGIASSSAGTNTKYLLTDAYVDKLYLVWSNQSFVSGRRCKITWIGVTRQ